MDFTAKENSMVTFGAFVRGVAFGLFLTAANVAFGSESGLMMDAKSVSYWTQVKAQRLAQNVADVVRALEQDKTFTRGLDALFEEYDALEREENETAFYFDSKIEEFKRKIFDFVCKSIKKMDVFTDSRREMDLGIWSAVSCRKPGQDARTILEKMRRPFERRAQDLREEGFYEEYQPLQLPIGTIITVSQDKDEAVLTFPESDHVTFSPDEDEAVVPSPFEDPE